MVKIMLLLILLVFSYAEGEVEQPKDQSTSIQPSSPQINKPDSTIHQPQPQTGSATSSPQVSNGAHQTSNSPEITPSTPVTTDIVTEEQTGTSSQISTKDTVQLQPSKTAQPNHSVSPQQSSQASASPQLHHQQPIETHSIPATQLDMTILTDQQRKKLLQEEAVRATLHSNPELDYSKLANMTHQQLLALQKTMREEAQRAYESAMQQMEERDKKNAAELQRMIAEQKLTKTQTVSHKQTVQFKQRENQFNPRLFTPGKDSYYRHNFNEYMFEIEEGEGEVFSITLPISQTVALYAYTYSNNDGIYTRTADIGNSSPVEIQVIEDLGSTIIRQSFYFKKYVIFEGKQNVTYQIQFNNPGEPRLFALSVVQLLQHTHIAHTITADSLEHHGMRAMVLYEELDQHIKQSYRNKLMEVSNMNALSHNINIYKLYSIGEIVLVLISCLLQIKMIGNLLRTSTIV